MNKLKYLPLLIGPTALICVALNCLISAILLLGISVLVIIILIIDSVIQYNKERKKFKEKNFKRFFSNEKREKT
jgi:hypothetical protein